MLMHTHVYVCRWMKTNREKLYSLCLLKSISHMANFIFYDNTFQKISIFLFPCQLFRQKHIYWLKGVCVFLISHTFCEKHQKLWELSIYKLTIKLNPCFGTNISSKVQGNILLIVDNSQHVQIGYVTLLPSRRVLKSCTHKSLLNNFN